VGLCVNPSSINFNRFVLGTDEYPCFTPITKNETEFYWCTTCRVNFHTALAEFHNGHAVSLDPYIDEDSYLETYVAD